MLTATVLLLLSSKATAREVLPLYYFDPTRQELNPPSSLNVPFGKLAARRVQQSLRSRKYE